ncbi:hypothetical protein A3Q56_06372 [Intoshia linei]|uniref:Uncharacterized protein n=1 Tax=Intoshia linei TaxID=1819745 RepID=A0A177AWZ5_9BILA|nr:hypothetical protein A3Q56_06372 [Intoshia linei]
MNLCILYFLVVLLHISSCRNNSNYHQGIRFEDTRKAVDLCFSNIQYDVGFLVKINSFFSCLFVNPTTARLTSVFYITIFFVIILCFIAYSLHFHYKIFLKKKIKQLVKILKNKFKPKTTHNDTEFIDLENIKCISGPITLENRFKFKKFLNG